MELPGIGGQGAKLARPLRGPGRVGAIPQVEEVNLLQVEDFIAREGPGEDGDDDASAPPAADGG